jgi:transposase
LERIDLIDKQIAQLEAEIEEQNVPLEEAVSLLAEIPGFDRTTAWSVIAEIGVDMNQFPRPPTWLPRLECVPETTKAPASVSVARREKGADGYGRSFARAPGAPLDPKTSYFTAYFQRIAAHRGKKRAIVAVSHSLLVVCYYLLQRKCHFQDLGVDYF